jgi:hypothetical protein
MGLRAMVSLKGMRFVILLKEMVGELLQEGTVCFVQIVGSSCLLLLDNPAFSAPAVARP